MSKQYYETYFILDGNLEDNSIEEIIKKYDSFLQKNDAEIKNIDRIGRRRLAYQIKRKQNGFYVCMEFESPPNLISKLERTYRLDDNILRFLTLHLDAKTLREKDVHMKKRAKILESRLQSQETEQSQEPEKSVNETGENKKAETLETT